MQSADLIPDGPRRRMPGSFLARHRWALRTGVIAAAIGGLLLIGIPPGPERDRGEEISGPPEPPPVRGGTLRVALPEGLDSLDPQLAAVPEAWFFIRALHRGVMAFPPAPFPDGAVPVPDLATGPPDVGDGGRTWTFQLDPAARFGPPADRAVRSTDVRASIERLLRLGPPIAEAFLIIDGAAEVLAGRAREARGIQTPDARTLTIRLRQPANDLPWLLALPQASAIPRELVDRFPLPPAEIAGSGPYRLAVYDPEEKIVLERNPSWDPGSDAARGAYVEEIEALVVGSQEETDRLIAGGEADLQPGILVPPPEPGRIAAHPNGCLRYLWMNVTVDPLGDPAVRRAVAQALDRDAVTARLGVPAKPASGILPPTVFGSPDAPAPGPDPQAARGLLADAGREAARVAITVADTPGDRAQAAAVRDALAAAGIDLEIRTVPALFLYPEWYERPARRVPMGLATWCADWPGLGGRAVLGALLDGRRIREERNTVYSMLRSPGLGEAFDRALAAGGLEEATAAWREAERIAGLRAAVIPVAWLTEEVHRSPRLRGLIAHPFFSRGDPTALWLEGGGR